MTEVKMALGRAEQLQDLLGSGIAVVQVVREAIDDSEYSNALMCAMIVLQHARKILDDAVEEAMRE